MLKNFLRKKITRTQLDKFVQDHRSDKYTLDLGAGNSPYSHYFTNRLGFDVAKGKGVDVVGDAHNLPFEDEKFEVIVCNEGLEHLRTPEKAISEMKRVLKKKGTLILTTRFIFPLHDAPHDYYRYTKYGLKHLFKDWKIIELREEVGTIKTIAVLLQGIAFQTEPMGGKFTKGIFFLLSKIILLFSGILKEEYGNRRSKNTIKEDSILTSGYYLVCRKRN